MTGDGQGHMGISEVTLQGVLAELPPPVSPRSVARMAGHRRWDREPLWHFLPYQWGALASPLTHSTLVLGRARACREKAPAPQMGQPARIDLSMAKLESLVLVDCRRMGEVHARARLAEAIDEPRPVVRCVDPQAWERRVIRSPVGQERVEILGPPLFLDHLILGIKPRHETVVRRSINATIECHRRAPQVGESSGGSGGTHPDGTA
jgi:hypothetical protein